MEADCEDSVGMEERLFYSVTMVHIDIQVKHPGVYLQKLQDAKHDIVNVAEPTGFRLLTMVISSRPVNCDIGLSRNNQISRIDTPSSGQFAEIIQSLKPRAIHSLVDFKDGVEFCVLPHLHSLLISH
jgi:hypothetical protein